MATASLITQFASLARESKYSLNVNPLLKTRTQVHYQAIRRNKSFLIKRPEYQNNNFRVQCCMKPNKSSEKEKEEKEKESTGNSLDEIIEVIFKTLNLFVQKSAIAGVVLGLLMTCNPHLALAASGGRMGGGHSFSGSSSSSSSSPSYSSGSSSWSSGSSSSSSWNNDSSSSSSDDERSSWSSYSSPSPSYYSASVSSSSWPSYSSPNSSSKASSVSEDEDEHKSAPGAQKSSPSEDKQNTAPGAPKSSPSEDEPKTASGARKSEDTTLEVLKLLGIVVIICGATILVSEFCRSRQSSVDANKTTVMMLQVALLGATRSLQKDLDKIAEVADTSTTSGLSYILQESTVTLLRHLAYCFSSYSSVDVKPDKTGGEKLFNQLTIEERAKFDEETLVNVDNIKKQSTPRKNPNGLSSDYIVMTILVAAKGENKLSVVNSSDNLKEALQKLGSIPTSKILAVEVMWTPQEENDTLTERELLKDYPRLRPL